jgi:hypothetical protein
LVATASPQRGDHDLLAIASPQRGDHDLLAAASPQHGHHDLLAAAAGPALILGRVTVGDRASATARTSQPSATGLRTNLAVLWVFITLIATYLLLVLAELSVASSSLFPIAGYVGITCGAAAWYVSFAHVTHATFGRDLIPTRPLA